MRKLRHLAIHSTGKQRNQQPQAEGVASEPKSQAPGWPCRPAGWEPSIPTSSFRGANCYFSSGSLLEGKRLRIGQVGHVYDEVLDPKAFRFDNSIVYLRYPSCPLSRWPRQGTPSGNKGGCWGAACPGSWWWFGSCTRNSPSRYKSHCRRRAFVCSPFHRSQSTEERRVEKRGWSSVCGQPTTDPWPPSRTLTLRQCCGALSLY